MAKEIEKEPDFQPLLQHALLGPSLVPALSYPFLLGASEHLLSGVVSVLLHTPRLAPPMDKVV